MIRIIIFGLIMSSLVFPIRDCLRQAETDALGRSTRDEKNTYAISDSGHFYIHYDTTGTEAPNLTDNNGNGIPDYIDEVGIIADSARHVLVNMMHFSVPPVDEDSIYDIYIKSLSSYEYGYNYKDNPSQNTSGTTSYLEIDNDYNGFNSIFDLSPMQIMRISVGHEYFHGIQWGYRENKSGNEYFYEMTSTWFEDILIPDGNDYLDGFADPLLNNPTADFDNTGKGYELALFGHYLSSFVDENGKTDEKNSTIMHEIWENFTSNSNSPSALVTVQNVLENSYNLPFINVWVDFMTRNLYNGIYEDMDNEFYYYIDQALSDPILTNSGLLEDNISIELNLDNKSVFLQSYEIGDLTSILDIKHGNEDYIGNIAFVTSDINSNNFSLAHNTMTNQLFAYDVVHFVYATESSNNNLVIDITQYTVPVPPSGLSITAAQDSMILYWSPSPGPGDSLYYIIYRNGNSLNVSPDTTYVDSNAIVGLTNYTYMVTCVNEKVGESLPSNSVTIPSWPTENNVTENQILNIYPNPIHKTHDSYILYALGTDYSNNTLELINIRGQIVKKVLLQSYQQGWHRESIKDLVSPETATGIYIIRIRPDNELGRTQKITILP